MGREKEAGAFKGAALETLILIETSQDCSWVQHSNQFQKQPHLSDSQCPHM